MLRDALFLARKDLRYMFRSRETWLWAFVMPVVFFYFIGTITGRGRGMGPAKDRIAVSIPPDAGFLAEQLIKRLESREYQVVRTASPQEFAAHARRLTIPAGFTGSVLAGRVVKITVERTGGGLDADYDQVRLSRAVYTVLADLVVAGKDGGAVTAESLARVAQAPRLLTLDVKAAGKRVNPPTGYEQSVPGTMVMFTLLVMFTSGGISLVVERNHGILRRLASSPMSRGAVVLGKWGSRMTLGIVQLAFAMISGTVLFHIRWGPNLPAVCLVLLTYAGLGAALGMLLGNFGRTEGQVAAIGVVSTNVIAALGGCWWPIEITPRWAQSLALLLPTGWAMDALHKLVNFGASPAAVVPHVAVTLAAGLLAGYAVARSFRFQ